ncbi:lipoprotein [Chryseobacterium sp. FH1]
MRKLIFILSLFLTITGCSQDKKNRIKQQNSNF